MRKTMARVLGAGVILLVAGTASADVTDSREAAFCIESTATTRASPAAVYAELGNVSHWWDPEHTWSGSARNLSLQLQAGGCFCEKLASGGSVQHLSLIHISEPTRLLSISYAVFCLKK